MIYSIDTRTFNITNIIDIIIRLKIRIKFDLHAQQSGNFNIFILFFIFTNGYENLFPKELARFLDAVSCLTTTYPNDNSKKNTFVLNSRVTFCRIQCKNKRVLFSFLVTKIVFVVVVKSRRPLSFVH